MGVLHHIIGHGHQFTGLLRTFWFLAPVLFLTRPVFAQDVYGGLEGRVVSTDGRALPGSAITVSSPGLQGAQRTTSASGGYFQLIALPVGTYTVRVDHFGHRSLIIEDLRVRLGQATTLWNIQLETEAMPLEPIVVQAAGVRIDPASSAIGSTLEAADFERLPTERDYKSIITLLPQINTSFLGDNTSAAGATGLENQFFVDGVNVTAPYKANASTNLPYNFIEAIEVKQGGYQAEYGGALGSIVNVVTYTGGNTFDFQALGYFSNGALAGVPKPGVADLRVDGFSSSDFGFRAGGPLVRDRLWFSVADNPRIDRQDVAIPGLGFARDSRTVHQFASKLTWKASPAADLTFSAFGDPTHHSRVGSLGSQFGLPALLANIDPFLAERTEGGVNLSLRAQVAVGSRLLLETTLARHTRSEDEVGRTEVSRTQPLFIDRTTGLWSGGLGQRIDLYSYRNSAKLSVTWSPGVHEFKVGGDYQETLVDKSEVFTPPGLIEFDGALFTTTVVRNVNKTRARLPTLYARDSWQVTDRVRVNAGVRWDAQFFIAAGDSVAQSFTRQWQPRIGLVLLPGKMGSQKVFAHYGRSFQQLPLSLFTIAHSQNDQRVRVSDVDPRIQPDSVLFEQVVVDPCCPAVTGVEGELGEHIDEFVVGYERVLGPNWKLGVRGSYRLLRGAFGSGFTLGPTGPRPLVGTRGKGALDFLPPGERDYRAVELGVARRGARWSAAASYVLSRTTGNYTGQFDLDTRNPFPGINFLVELETQAPNSAGVLPNDRTHVFKLTGAYEAGFGLDAGLFATWQSGTPLSTFGSTGFLFRPLFLSPRGSKGRMPALVDVSLRLAYDLPARGAKLPRGRILLDILHLTNTREVVDVDQTQFQGVDPALGPLAAFTEPHAVLVGRQVAPNPNFGAALRHQPPLTLRLGIQFAP